MTKIAIIGGGFAGLGAAYALAGRKSAEIELFESSPEFGGLAGVFPVGGTHLETYYHHLFPTNSAIISLANNLGVRDKLFFKKARTGTFYDGKLYPFTSPVDILRFSAIPFFDRLRLGAGAVALKLVRNGKRFENSKASETLPYIFGRKAFEAVWKPLLEGKFGSHANEIGMAWFWSRIFERPEKFGYFGGGFKTLTDALATNIRARGVRAHISAPVIALKQNNNGRWLIQTPENESLFDAVLAAVNPAILLKIASWLPEAYTGNLRKLTYYGTVSAVIVLDRPFSPYYWMNVNDPNLPFLAVVEQTNFIPPERYGGNHIIYVAKYLDPEGDLYCLSDAQIYELYVSKLARIRADFDRSWVREYRVFRSPATQPIIKAGYASIQPEIKTPFPGLYFASMSHIYPWDRGVDRSFSLGIKAARVIENEVLREPVTSAK
jgi:protoporphyrinogen oxidase